MFDRAILTEQDAATRGHQAREARFDPRHGTIMLKLTDGRVVGAEPNCVPSLQGASPYQLQSLHASDDGIYLILKDLDLHITVDGLITRIIERSPQTIRRANARPAVKATT